MKELLKRMDAILILAAAVVYKRNADPAETLMIIVCAVFCVGVVIDSARALKLQLRKEEHKEWCKRVKESDQRFRHMLDIMEGIK